MAIFCCENVRIPSLNSLTVEEFNQNYLKVGKPVIIKEAIVDWPAFEWTLEGLQSKVGHHIVHVRSNTNCNQYKTGQQYGIRQTTFGEYIQDIRSNRKRSLNSYLAVQNIKKALPELEPDIRIPPYVGKVHGGPFLWIANQGHYEYNHVDPDDGFLITIRGLKQVRLFPCQSIHRLYPNELGTKGRTIQSQVDCDNPDLNVHPNFEGTICHYGYVSSGQMLYIPAFWWHQVTSVHTTISINIFWGEAGENVYSLKVMREPTWCCFKYWLLNIIEQNRSQPSFPRILSRLNETLANFLMTQWHESLDARQINTLVGVVREYLVQKQDHNVMFLWPGGGLLSVDGGGGNCGGGCDNYVGGDVGGVCVDEKYKSNNNIECGGNAMDNDDGDGCNNNVVVDGGVLTKDGCLVNADACKEGEVNDGLKDVDGSGCQKTHNDECQRTPHIGSDGCKRTPHNAPVLKIRGLLWRK